MLEERDEDEDEEEEEEERREGKREKEERDAWRRLGGVEANREPSLFTDFT